MKKIISAVALATTISTANAMAVPRYIGAQHAVSNYQYHTGYRHGKDDAYAHVARTLFVAGAIVIAGTLIYHLGEGSNWTANEKGIVYKF